MNKSFVSILAMFSSCSSGSEFCPLRGVDRAEYTSVDSCWINNENKFEAFVIISSGSTDYVPMFVSKKCASFDVDDKRNEVYNVVRYNSPILVKGMDVPYKKGKIVSNMMSHLPDIKETDDVYYLKSDYRKLSDNSSPYFELYKFEMFKNTDLNVKRFFQKRSGCINNEI